MPESRERLVFVDSNIFLRVLVQENEQSFHECLAVLKAVEQGKVRAITSPLVLAEVNWVLSSFYHFPKPRVLEALRGILHLPGLKVMDAHDARHALELFSRASVKFIDALLVSHAAVLHGSCAILSYDRDFDRLGVARVEPRELLSKIREREK